VPPIGTPLVYPASTIARGSTGTPVNAAPPKKRTLIRVPEVT